LSGVKIIGEWAGQQKRGWVNGPRAKNRGYLNKLVVKRTLRTQWRDENREKGVIKRTRGSDYCGEENLNPGRKA